MAEQIAIAKHVMDKIQKFKNLLKEEGYVVSQMLVFGSHAKGVARLDSDIDLAVVSPIFGHDYFDEMIRLRKLSLRIDSQLEPLPFGPEDLSDPYSSLAHEISQHGLQV
jgi:predicted nucleotidyltransferase